MSEKKFFEQSNAVRQLVRDGYKKIAQETSEQDHTIELAVIGYNRGGLLVEWNSLRGFVPASQLVSFPAVVDSQVRRGELANRVLRPRSIRRASCEAPKTVCGPTSRTRVKRPARDASPATRFPIP